MNYGAPGLEAAWIEPLLGLSMTNNSKAEIAAEGTKLRREISPIYFIHSNHPPVLIIQGDKDYMVPVEQARTFAARSLELGNKVKLIIKPGKGHGWPEMAQDMESVIELRRTSQEHFQHRGEKKPVIAQCLGAFNNSASNHSITDSMSCAISGQP